MSQHLKQNRPQPTGIPPPGRVREPRAEEISAGLVASMFFAVASFVFGFIAGVACR